MVTSEPVSGIESDEQIRSPNSIYEQSRTRASKVHRDGPVWQAASGICISTALWFLIAELGFPQIVGMGKFGLLAPFLVAGALLGLTRLRRLLLSVTLSLLGVVCVIAYTDIMRTPSQKLIRSDAIPASADAIVVLSAGVSADGLLPQQSLDRLLKGIELSRSGIAPRIVLTRERRKVNGQWVTSMADQNRLIALGGGVEVISTGVVASTRDEALRVADLARRNGWKRIVLVTSPFHSTRACATFEKAGLTISCVPSESRDVSVRNVVGSDNRIRAFGMWIYELAGTVRYWQAGWI